MGKTKTTTDTDKDSKVTSKLNRRENKIRKKLRLKDFVKSPSSQQCNKISTWLNKEQKKSPSCPIQHNICGLDEEVKILYMKDGKRQDTSKKKFNPDIAHNSVHDTNRQKINIEKEQLIIKPFSNKYGDENLLKKPQGLQSSKSSPISATNNVTPTKGKRVNEPVILRRSPRTSKSPPIPTLVKKITKEKHEGEKSLKRLKSSRSPSLSVAKKLFNECDIPPNSALHMWLTNHDQRKNFKPENFIGPQENRKACFKINSLKVEDLSSDTGRKRSTSDENKRKRAKEKNDKSTNKLNKDNKDSCKLESRENVNKEKLLNTWLEKPKQKNRIRPLSSGSSSKNDVCPETERVREKEYKSSKSLSDKEPLRKKQKLNTEGIKYKSTDKRVEPKTSDSKKHTGNIDTDKVKKTHKEKENRSTSEKKNEQTIDKTRTDCKKQKKLDNYVGKRLKEKASKKSKLNRNSSSDISEFPSFGSTEKSSTSESFKKYGVTLPTTKGILKEQEDLKKYKSEIESFRDIEIDPYDLPFSVNDLNNPKNIDIPILDCKHLTMDKIEEHFKKHLPYISDIFFGKTYNERHEKFFSNKYKSYKHKVKDLMCSSSVVVFSYDQKEHMINLMRDSFDSEDEWTPYFFQILLPELCLRIFMDVHNMTQDEAVKYLDVMPITND